MTAPSEMDMVEKVARAIGLFYVFTDDGKQTCGEFADKSR